MDKHQKIEHLKKQMREKRAQINPDVLIQAQAMAEKKMAEKMAPAKKTSAGSSVPYDREAALKAIDIFLKDHPDRARIREQMRESLDKNTH